MSAVAAASVYVHIPFCVRKCAYCDFASWAGREADLGRYFSRLTEEAEAARKKYGPMRVPSVYIGGGTPTSVPAESLCGFLQKFFSLFSIDPDAEITVEGNPGTVSQTALRSLRTAGVNRLSFGAQAYQEPLLRTLGRIHGPADIDAAVDMARDAGFSNISLDLMYALPGQTMADWRESLSRALRAGVTHLSCYSLICEEGTPLTGRVERGELCLPDEDTVLRMQREAATVLAEKGLLRYEISNYALPGFESRHNLRYWTRGDYLGLGCAAHSLMDGVRFHAPEKLDAYLNGGTVEDAMTLSARDAREEAVLLETRTTHGIDLAAFSARYGVRFLEEYGTGATELLNGGYAVIADGCFRLTERGLDVQSAAVVELLTRGAGTQACPIPQ